MAEDAERPAITRALGRVRRGMAPSVEMDAAFAAVQARMFRAPDAVTLLGRYRIERELGRGGMGVVYAARDLTTDAKVAIKLMRARRDGAVQFRREFQTLARLEHPRVVAVYDFGRAGSDLFYTMELLEGSDLRALGKVEVERACAIVRDIASALAMLHARRLLHGDLSPRNIRCSFAGQAKLIDFGLLSTMGPALGLAGTPPYMAPECLLGRPLDQRADLFGLGSVFYFLLAGRDAFEARTFDERLQALRAGVTPRPPSAISPEIPAGVDALVMAMLAADRQARPHTAADVIDRIHALAELPPAPELEIARGWVRSAALIGRETELRVLRQRAQAAAEGRGSTVLLRGRTGAGKSRLLRELGIDAKLQGIAVVHVPTDTRGRGPFEVLRRVSEELGRALPQLVEETARPRVAHLVAAIPELRALVHTAVAAAPLTDPREQRLLLQREVTEWLAELSRRHPLALLLDDVQRCDEASAAVLLALARRIDGCRILLAGSLRSDEAPLAAAPIAALERVAESMTIKGLGAADMEMLVRASVGDVPGVARLAAFLRSKTGGSPLLATDLLASLVDTGRIAYARGMWMIADDVDAATLPESIQASCDTQIAALGAPAREVAELLAIHGGPVSLETCVALVGDETAAFEAVDELLEEEILVGSALAYRFRHDGVQEAVTRCIDPARRGALHRRVGGILRQQAGVGHERDAEVGWHLVRGGEEHAGAERLERAGRRLFQSTSFGDAIRPLSTAIEVYERHGLHADRLPELYYMLALSGFFADHHVADRVSRRALELLAAQSGIERIRSRQRLLGHRVGFLGGLAETELARRTRPGARRGPSPKQALNMFTRTVIMSAGLALAQTERERLLELLHLMEPLSRIRIGNLDRVFRFLTMMEGVGFGRFGEVRQTASELLAEASSRRARSWATDFELRVFHGAVRFVYGLALAHGARDHALENIEALERIGVRVWELGALQLRQTYHLRRGEMDAAREILGRLELGYAELGSLWQVELGLAPAYALARALIGDVSGLRRSIDQLERLVDRGLGYTGALDVTRAEYHRERGELDQALAAAERALPNFDKGGWGLGWALTCRAHVLLDAGRLDEAMDAIELAMRHVADPVYRDDGVYFRGGRVHALVHAARGDVETAGRLLDRLVVEAAPSENPAYLGLLHEARAIVADEAQDATLRDRHRRIADAWFRGTDNPVLIARMDRLDALVRGASSSVPSASPAPPTSTHRLDEAIARLLAATGAASGYLYLEADGRLTRVAPGNGEDPPPGLASVLERAKRHGLGWHHLYRGPGGTWHPIVLRVDPSLDSPPLAVAAVRAGDAPLRPPDLALVAELAQAISTSTSASQAKSRAAAKDAAGSPVSDEDEPETVVE